MTISTTNTPHATLIVCTSAGDETMSMAVRQITISQAAKALDIRPELLRHLVAAGVVSGDKSICDFEQAAQIVARLQNARLAADGCGILAREAATKYKFEVNSIYKWHSDGWIKALSEKGRNRIFNEGDIALARELADLVGHTPGRAIFPAKPRSGRPRKSTPPPIPPNP